MHAVPFNGTPAAGFTDKRRQLSGVVSAGTYVVLYTVGYADSRPREPVTGDSYADEEMTSAGAGVRTPCCRCSPRRCRRPAARGHLDAENAEEACRVLEGARPRRWHPALAAGRSAMLACLPAAAAVAAPADSVRDQQQWVFSMMNVQAAWQVTEGSGVTVAVIDSGVNPDVSDLIGELGNLRPRLHRAAHLAGEPRLGPARDVDGVHHRRARQRRRLSTG